MQWKKFTGRTDGSGIIRTRDDGNTQTENDDETAMTMSFFHLLYLSGTNGQ